MKIFCAFILFAAAVLLAEKPTSAVDIQTVGDGVGLTWTSTNGVMQSATSLAGPWTPASNVFSPYIVLPLPAPEMFFRLSFGPGSDSPPSAAGGFYSVVHDQSLYVLAPGVLTNDVSFVGGTLAAQLVSGPASGTLSLFSDGSFIYVPNAGFVGGDSFTYTAADDLGVSTPAAVLLQVINTAPLSQNDAYASPAGISLAVSAPGVLANDVDPDGDTLTAALVSGPANGTLTLNVDGSFVYESTAGFAGTDSFTYQASDGITNGNTATVSLTIHPLNAAPSALASSYGVTHDQLLAVSAPGVLSGASDPDGDVVFASVSSPPVNGTVTLNSDGSFDYVPNPGYVGPDSFSFTPNDGLTNGAPATVSISVTNSAPVATADIYSMHPNSTLTVPPSGVLVNDSDPDGDLLSAQLIASPANGSLVFSTNGSFTYIPNANFAGTDFFTYEASDGLTNSAPTLVAIQVTNNAPVAEPDVYGAHPSMTLSVTAPGVLLNDTDADGDSLTAALFSPAANGSVSLNADGSFTYTPNAGFIGTDNFAYTASDGFTNSFPAMVTINVHATNAAPISAPAEYFIQANYTLVVDSLDSVLSDDEDADGDVLSAQLLTGPANGTLTLNIDGTFVYTPNPEFVGVDGFAYLPSDGLATGQPTAVEINVGNHPPFAAPDTYTLHVNDSLEIDSPGVLANDGDADYDLITAVLVSDATNGTLQLDGDGSFYYTPNPGFLGADGFTYAAFDGTAFSSPATVTLNVTDTAPVATEDDYTMSANTSFTNVAPGVLENDDDADGDPLTASLVSGPANGVLTFNSDGSFVYTPNPGFIGTDEFFYQASDGFLASASTPVMVTVTNAIILLSRSPVNGGGGGGGGGGGPASLTLKQVTFQDPANTNYLPLGVSGVRRSVYKDGSGTNGSPVAYPQPEWLSGRTNQSAFIYRRASTMLASVWLTPKNVATDSVVTVQGDVYLAGLPQALRALQPGDAYPANPPAPDFIFAPMEAELSSGFYKTVTNVVVTNTPKNQPPVVKTNALHVMIADSPLPDKVTKYASFSVAWHYNIGGAAEVFAGSSVNALYSIYDTPQAAYVPPQLEGQKTPSVPLTFLTVVDYGCSAGQAMGGNPDARKLVSKIFDLAFGNGMPANTKRTDGKLLCYYKSWSTNSHQHSVAGLLSAGDDECDTWARFYLAMLQAQGLYIGNFTGIGTTANDTQFFLVKNWGFGNNAFGINNSSKPTFGGFPVFSQHGGVWNFDFDAPAVPDNPGVPGQNTTNPVSIFNNHVVVRIEDTDPGNNTTTVKYYDPSYGVIYNSIDDVQKKAIDGFCIFQLPAAPNPRGPRATYKMRKTGDKTEMVERFFSTGEIKDIKFTVQPKNVAAGANFSVSVAVVDQLGNPLTNVRQLVYLGLGNGNFAGFTRPAPVTTAQGVATFNLSLPTGTAYTLTAWTFFDPPPNTLFPKPIGSRQLISAMFDVN